MHLSTLLFVSISVTLAAANVDQAYQQFRSAYPRAEGRSGEDPRRKEIFARNYDRIQQHNKEAAEGKHSFRMGVTQFTDWTEDEMKSLLRSDDVKEPTDRKPVFRTKEDEQKFQQRQAIMGRAELPDHFDWRDKGVISPIRSQSPCASCWAFGATAAIEAMLMIKYNQSIDLSEQHLMDCVDMKYDRYYLYCQHGGGWPSWAYRYIVDNNGYALEQQYPYDTTSTKNEDVVCKNDPERFRYGDISGFVTITPGDEEEMKRVIATVGPISVDIDAGGSFGWLTDGIFEREGCGVERGNHIVTIVGYGTEDGKDYWIVKNSWGTGWGVNGFGRMLRGKNMCAIAMHADYPVRY